MSRTGLPGAMWCHSTPVFVLHDRMALLVSSVPLSLAIICSLPRSAMSRSSSRATRTPERDVSAISARFSRVQSSTMVGTRNRQPSVNGSQTKSRL